MGVPDGSLVAHRQLVTAPRPAARQHGAAILRFHPGPESVSLRALAIIGLKCTFRHGLSSLGRGRRTCRSNFETPSVYHVGRAIGPQPPTGGFLFPYNSNFPFTIMSFTRNSTVR
jgi:hypothetical protein